MSLSMVLQTIRSLTAKSTLKTAPCAHFFSSKLPKQEIGRDGDPKTGLTRKKLTDIVPKITLVTGDSVSVTTLEEAEKISRRRDLMLIKITDVDAKTQRPVYRMLSGAEYHAEDLQQRNLRKFEKGQQFMRGEKVLLINSKIAQHDLETQLRRALSWTKKMYEVRVIISGANGHLERSEKVYAAIEQYFKNEDCEAKLVQKRTKGSDIKFQIKVVPPTYESRSNDL